MTESKILIVDDEIDICKQLVGVLADKGYSSDYVLTSEKAINFVKNEKISLVLLDIWLNNSKFDGFQALEKILQLNNSIPVIMISGHGNIETAVNSIKKGAYDFIEKPFDSDLLIFKVKKALENFKLKQKIQQLTKKEIETKVVSKSNSMSKLLSSLKKVSKNDSPILLHGKPGAGKSFVAKYIHDQSNRFDKNFRIINFKNNETLRLEIELFGNEVNQIMQIAGIFDELDGGTIFLKNFDSMSKTIQGKFLRILEEKKYYRVGGHNPMSINFRIIASSYITIEEIKKHKNIRNDLIKKLDFDCFNIPDIENRKDDLEGLIEIFVDETKLREKNRKKKFSTNAIDFFCNLDSIKNLSQLRNLIEWCLIMLAKNNLEIITKDMIQEIINEFVNSEELINEKEKKIMDSKLKEARECFEKNYLLYNLSKYNFNITKMSTMIGMDRTALHRKLRSMKINTDIK